MTLYLVFYFIIYMKERERAGKRGRERERESLKQVPHSAWSPMQSSLPQCWDRDLSGNREVDAHLTEPPRCPR